MAMAILAPTIARVVELPEWILIEKNHYTLVAGDFECEVGQSRVIAYQTFFHPLASCLLKWQVGLLINEDGLVHLAFRLLNEDPVPCLPFFELNFTALGTLEGLDGQLWSMFKSFPGNELPTLRMHGTWYSMWSASREPIGPQVPSGMRSIHEFINLRTGRLKINFHMDFWRNTVDILRSSISLNAFDVRSLPSLSDELRAIPLDVCLVTGDGIIKAHSSKICVEFPGLLGDVNTAPVRCGYYWGVVKVPFNTLVEIVQLMYNCYYKVVEVNFSYLLDLANRLNLRELYAKILQWQITYQPLPSDGVC